MAGNIKILVVDDNPMVLGLLRQVLSPMADVHVAGNPADALLRAIDDPPDLLVTDYQMPGMDGRQLMEKLRARQDTARLPVVMLAAQSDIQERLKAVQDQVEDLVPKPFYTRELAARVKRVVDRISLEKMARSAQSGGFRGTLAQMNAIDLLQSLDMGRKTCALVLTRNGDRCEMYFDEGHLRHAVYGDVKGDEAVYRALLWPVDEGNFEIDFNARTAEQTTTRSTQGLLMEGMRLLDEANRDSES